MRRIKSFYLICCFLLSSPSLVAAQEFSVDTCAADQLGLVIDEMPIDVSISDRGKSKGSDPLNSPLAVAFFVTIAVRKSQPRSLDHTTRCPTRQREAMYLVKAFRTIAPLLHCSKSSSPIKSRLLIFWRFRHILPKVQNQMALAVGRLSLKWK